MSAEAAQTATVACLKFEFLWNGKELAAGRTPVYGMEAPAKDMARGTSKSSGTEVFELSPLPFRYFPHLQKRHGSIELSPGIPAQPGELTIRIAISTDPSDAARWAEKGMYGSEGTALLPELAGEPPKALDVDLTYSKGNASSTLSLSSQEEFVMKLDALGEGEVQPFTLRFPDFELKWERRKEYLPLRWPKGAPAAAQQAPAPKPAPVRAKAPFWMFWKRGE